MIINEVLKGKVLLADLVEECEISKFIILGSSSTVVKRGVGFISGMRMANAYFITDIHWASLMDKKGKKKKKKK